MVIQVRRQGFPLQPAHLLHLSLLAGDVALVFQGDLHLLPNRLGQGGAVWVQGSQILIGQAGPAHQVGQAQAVFGRGLPLGGQQLVQLRRGRHTGVLQAVNLPFHLLIFLLHPLVPLPAHQADGIPNGAHPLVRVVLAVEEAVLGPGGHHPVGLVGPLGHQVVDEHTDVPLTSVQDKWGAP